MVCKGRSWRKVRIVGDTWYSETVPEHLRPTPMGWVRVIVRAVPLIVLVFGGLLVLLALRLIEKPLFGARRPMTPHITQRVCRAAFVVLGMRFTTDGVPLQGAGAVVANHASWLDIFALNARKRIYFVSKSEVAGWPGIGWLARATGTVFIKRDRSALRDQIAVFQNRLAAGHKLLFFPEGTSSDGLQVLPFKPALFAAFFDPDLRPTLQMQAVSVIYTAPEGMDARFYGWWGDMDFGPHLISTLAAGSPGNVHVVYHPPVNVADFPDRKTLAKAMEDQVRSGLTQHRLP